MGDCFVDHETVPGGVKRIALEQLDKAVKQTKPEAKDQDEAIHDARVSLKKLRALLRLARAKHNDDVFAHENTYYRDAGRRLSEVRDTTAMIAAFDKLAEHYVDQLTLNAFTCQSNMARGEDQSRGCGSARACCRSIRPAEHLMPARNARTPTLLPLWQSLTGLASHPVLVHDILEVYKFAQTAPLVYEKVRSIS